MRKLKFKILILSSVMCFISYNKTNAQESVEIGEQEWMLYNLDVSTFNNGDSIPEAKTEEEWKNAGKEGKPAWCYYNNDPKNGEKYGKLYNWYAVNDPRGLAPEGWHIPTSAEWTELTNFLGTFDTGSKLKNDNGWGSDGNYGNGNNESGFSGLPGGARHYGNNFNGIGYFGYWWSSTEYKKDRSWHLRLWAGDGYALRDCYDGFKKYGCSVRCIKD